MRLDDTVRSALRQIHVISVRRRIDHFLFGLSLVHPFALCIFEVWLR